MRDSPHTMKKLLLLASLCVPLACQATEADATATQPPEGRCPPPRIDKLRQMPAGDFDFTVRYRVKADGSIENIRVEGGLASRDARRVARDLFDGLRCLPAETDQEYVSKLRTRTGSH